MAYSVVITDEAARDMDEIFNYLIEQLHAPQAAAALMAEYDEILDKLESYPYMFEESSVSARRKGMYHKFLLGKYVGLYQVQEAEKCVAIARIFHGSQNYRKYL